MSDLTDSLRAHGQQHQGTDLGGVLQWAALHIDNQDEALAAYLLAKRAMHSGCTIYGRAARHRSGIGHQLRAPELLPPLPNIFGRTDRIRHWRQRRTDRRPRG